MTKGKTNKRTLPDKPSELLRLAVHDAKLCARSKKYVLNMEAWHDLDHNGCNVCMAGAVIAKTLQKGTDCNGEQLGEHVWNRLHVINCLRTGSTTFTAYNMYTLLRTHPAQQLISTHFDQRKGRAPWRIYLQAADLLEADGL